MSSLMPNQHVVQHFTHIHPLTLVDGHGEFTCDGCKTYGYGKTYRCDWCDYNLHDHCATCPPTLHSFMHPQHELHLVNMGPDQPKRMCDICDEPVQGLYYQCGPCSFDVHPLCTRLPQHVRHVPHPAHLLELSHWGASNVCTVCNSDIRSWRYKCGPCGLDVHMECVNTSATTQQRGFGSQPQFHHSQHHHQPYYDHGYGRNGPYGYNYGHMNQGKAQEPGQSVGRRMFSILMTLTIGVVCNIIALPVGDVLGSCF